MSSDVSIAQINQAAAAGDSFYLTLVKNQSPYPSKKNLMSPEGLRSTLFTNMKKANASSANRTPMYY